MNLLCRNLFVVGDSAQVGESMLMVLCTMAPLMEFAMALSVIPAASPL